MKEARQGYELLTGQTSFCSERLESRSDGLPLAPVGIYPLRAIGQVRLLPWSAKVTDGFTIDWTGESGKTYKYWSSEFTSSYKDEGGNYMFVKPTGSNRYVPVYIGQADGLKDRLPNHERIADAKRAGATLVMTHTTPGGEHGRLAEERDLIRKWAPSLNTHHQKAS